jgi:hypothetical protein
VRLDQSRVSVDVWRNPGVRHESSHLREQIHVVCAQQVLEQPVAAPQTRGQVGRFHKKDDLGGIADPSSLLVGIHQHVDDRRGGGTVVGIRERALDGAEDEGRGGVGAYHLVEEAIGLWEEGGGAEVHGEVGECIGGRG